jgi:hypothetical protein
MGNYPGVQWESQRLGIFSVERLKGLEGNVDTILK